jgi:hypothetical protein
VSTESVTHAVLLWALPDAWTQYELLAPDVEARVTEAMQRRFEGNGIDQADLGRVIALQIESLRAFADDGVVLLATRGEAASEAGLPGGLSLTLALANRPVPGIPAGRPATGQMPVGPDSLGAPAFVSEVTPLALEDPALTAFTRESRTEVLVPGLGDPLGQFQAQAFVLPNDHLGMAVVTVTTFNPAFEQEACDIARNFADTLCFVTEDDVDPEDTPSPLN